MAKRPTKAVFLVNPASDGGSTGRRWPELARRASALGLAGDALFSEQPEHLRELARHAAEDGADAGRGRRRRRHGQRGRVGHRRSPRCRAGRDPARNGRRLRAHLRDPGEARRRGRRRAARAYALDRRRPRRFPRLVGRRRRGLVLQRRRSRDERRRRQADERVVEGPRWEGAPTSGRHSPCSRAGGTPRCASRSTASERERRMHEVVVANGRYLGGGMLMCPDASPDDGLFDVLLIGDVHEARPRPDAAEDLSRHASPPPQGGAAARSRRCPSTPTSRCRSSSTASSRARRRCASRSCRRALAPARAALARGRLARTGRRGLRASAVRVVFAFAASPPAWARQRRRACVSSSATRRSSGSRLRMRFDSSSTRSRSAVRRLDDLGRRPEARPEPLDRILAGLGQPREHVLLLLLPLGHGGT